jgi:hypothetical protein
MRKLLTRVNLMVRRKFRAGPLSARNTYDLRTDEVFALVSLSAMTISMRMPQ